MALSVREQIEQFERYLQEITSRLEIDEQEKKELKEEWRQHLYDSLDSLMKKGMDKDEAINAAIQQFGEVEPLKEEVNRTYPSARKLHYQKELFIWLTCMLAAMIGPYLLIRAHFNIGFILTPMIFLAVSYALYHYVVKRISFPVVALLLVPVIYWFFINTFFSYSDPNHPDYQFTFERYAQVIFSLDWNELTGSEGIFTFPALHMLWYAVILWKMAAHKRDQSLWKTISIASFQYWAMAFIGVLFARGASSAEAGVIEMNILLLYGFLQQIVYPLDWVIWKQKIIHWVKRYN